ncbi:MAG: AAA family ATPase [Betaproteobacteria bacterium AqS2]|uniref:AAA family ATPase n=1 Tax=Candidatus Amphirhobacter heronislandensis TaxID=1732024 RepID=A0A930UHW3_9GAMM|nr:AAA family ATPase [Betaproteobacteria bacterium AqS2]
METSFAYPLVRQRAFEYLNPWRADGRPPPEHNEPRRLYYPSFASWVFNSRPGWTTALTGMQRIGKTQMLRQLVGDALAQGIYTPGQIVLLSARNYDIRKRCIMEHVRACQDTLVNPDKDWLLLLDEVQFFEDWEARLKNIADHEPRIKCVAACSAATALKKTRADSGLGRIQWFHMPPPLFCEYLEFRNAWPSRLPRGDFDAMVQARLPAAELAELNKEFTGYIQSGAFPELLFEKGNLGDGSDDESASSLLHRNLVINIIDDSLPYLLGTSDIFLLHQLAMFLVKNGTHPFSQKDCLAKIKAAPATLRRYLAFLEAVYFIRSFKKFDLSRRDPRHRHTHCKFIMENCSIPALVAAGFPDPPPPTEREIEAVVLSQFDTSKPLDDFGYVSFRRQNRKVEISLCHLDIRDWPIMLAAVKWRDDSQVFGQTADDLAYLLGKWRREDDKQPQCFCTSQSVYGELGDVRIIPAAQFSAALGMKRVANYPMLLKRAQVSS